MASMVAWVPARALAAVARARLQAPRSVTRAAERVLKCLPSSSARQDSRCSPATCGTSGAAGSQTGRQGQGRQHPYGSFASSGALLAAPSVSLAASEGEDSDLAILRELLPEEEGWTEDERLSLFTWQGAA